MSTRRRLLIFAGSGIGGTEKCASLFASTLRRRGHVVGYVSAPGPRADALEMEGVEIISPSDDPLVIAGKIGAFKPEIVHQHVPGYVCDNPIYKALEHLADQRIKLIETNVFGRLEDPEGLKRVDFRMFVSSASAVQAFRRAAKVLNQATIGNQIVVTNPVREPEVKYSIDACVHFRKTLGVLENEILFYRVGQPGHKWTLWEVEAFKIIKRDVPNVRLLLMEPPRELCKWIEPEALSLGIILQKATSDFAWLEMLNQSADIAFHASAWGESFGYTIAEAMIAGRPVITRSTPWGDNAQVELVENGKTGYVCLTTEEMARRGIDLAMNESLRDGMGDSGRQRIQQLANQETETDILVAVMEFVLSGTKSLLIEKRQNDLLQFSKTFSQREYSFSEPITTYPVEKISSLGYLIYKTMRGRMRTLLSRSGY